MQPLGFEPRSPTWETNDLPLMQQGNPPPPHSLDQGIRLLGFRHGYFTIFSSFTHPTRKPDLGWVPKVTTWMGNQNLLKGESPLGQRESSLLHMDRIFSVIRLCDSCYMNKLKTASLRCHCFFFSSFFTIMLCYNQKHTVRGGCCSFVLDGRQWQRAPWLFWRWESHRLPLSVLKKSVRSV